MYHENTTILYTILTLVCSVQADIVFVLDTSGSVDDGEWSKMLDFTKGLINELVIGSTAIRVGIVQYSNTYKEELMLKDGITMQAIVTSLDKIRRLKKGTNTAAAIDITRTSMFTTGNGNRASVKDIAIVVTDGKSSSKSATITAANSARSAGIIMYSVGIGNNLELSEINSIANAPTASHAFVASNFVALATSVKQMIGEKICTGEGKQP